MQRQTTVSSENKLVMAEYKLSQLENKIKQVSLGVKQYLIIRQYALSVVNVR